MKWGKCHKSTDYYPSQYVKFIGQLHAAAYLQRYTLARVTCGVQCRSALFAEEVIPLPLPVLETPTPSCSPVTLLT